MGLSGSRLCVDSNSLTPLGPIPKQNHPGLFYSHNFTQFCKWLDGRGAVSQFAVSWEVERSRHFYGSTSWPGGKLTANVKCGCGRDIPHVLLASSAESVGRFWFRESSQVVIEGNFHSLVGTKAVGSSGNHSDFVVEALNGAIGNFFFGPKPIQDQRLMGAQHAGHPFHRFQTAPHGPGAPVVEKSAGPDHGFVLPEMGKGLLQIPGPCGGQLAGEQGIELLPSSPAYPAAA